MFGIFPLNSLTKNTVGTKNLAQCPPEKPRVWKEVFSVFVTPFSFFMLTLVLLIASALDVLRFLTTPVLHLFMTDTGTSLILSHCLAPALEGESPCRSAGLGAPASRPPGVRCGRGWEGRRRPFFERWQGVCWKLSRPGSRGVEWWARRLRPLGLGRRTEFPGAPRGPFAPTAPSLFGETCGHGGFSSLKSCVGGVFRAGCLEEEEQHRGSAGRGSRTPAGRPRLDARRVPPGVSPPGVPQRQVRSCPAEIQRAEPGLPGREYPSALPAPFSTAPVPAPPCPPSRRRSTEAPALGPAASCGLTTALRVARMSLSKPRGRTPYGSLSS